jgi:hypothetical protein
VKLTWIDNAPKKVSWFDRWLGLDLAPTKWCGFRADGLMVAEVVSVGVGFWAKPVSDILCTKTFATLEQAQSFCEGTIRG